MKFLIATLTAFLPVLLFGQITLTVSDFSDGGDAVWMSTTVDPTIDFSSTGANYTWDFSGLSYQDQEYRAYSNMSAASTLVNVVFGFFASPEYQATNFISSTAIPLDQIGGFLPVNLSDVNQFSKNSSSGITSVGFSLTVEGNEVPFKSDTIETRYALPMNYGDAYTSRGYSNLDMNPFYNGIWRQHRKRTSNVDGWGSITTPFGTFDALRIDHFIEESDSIYMEAFGTGFWIPLPIPDTHEYEWWTNGEKEPILRITTSDIAGMETVTAIEYRDDYHGVDASIDELDISVRLFPNPASNELHISGLETEVAYAIVSVNGDRVAGGNLSTGQTVVDIAHLSPGTYSFVVVSNDRISTNSFIKK